MKIGTIWEDREDGRKFKVEAVTGDGRVQLSSLDGAKGANGYRVMKEISLRKNYKAVATKEEALTREQKDEDGLAEWQNQNCVGCSFADPETVGTGKPCCTRLRGPEVEDGTCIARKPKDEDQETSEAPDEKVESLRRTIRENPAPTQEATPSRAAVGRVQMPDGQIIAGSTFITSVCGKSRNDTYKVDSPIRWLVKKGQELLTSKGAVIVYGQPITK